MALDTLNDLLVNELQRLYAAEKHGQRVLPRLQKAASSADLVTALRKHGDQGKQHLSRLETIFDDLNIKPRPRAAESAGMKGLCTDCIDLAEDGTGDPCVRDAAVIAAAQHVEHDEIAGYGCARTWARELGHTGAANLLQKTLDEEKASDARLSKLAERINEDAAEHAMA